MHPKYHQTILLSVIAVCWLGDLLVNVGIKIVFHVKRL